MQRPLLSLCIPTYNRSDYLKKCIESIINQKEFQEGTVEIVISDNASDDNTKDVVQEYTKRFDNIIYSRNEKNVRDENFPIVLSLGRGVLRKLCNDTLIFLPNSLKEMCDIISSCQEERPYVFWMNKNKKNIKGVKKVGFREFVLEVSYWMTSIACFSIWDNECIDIKDDKDGADLSLWQVRKGLELAYKKNSIVICNKKITDLQSVSNKNISYGLYKVFYENYFKLLDPYFAIQRLTFDDKGKLEKDLLFEFFLNWCIGWELSNQRCQYSKEENLKEAIEKQYRNKEYWFEYEKIYRRRKIKEKIKNFIKRN